MLELIKIEKMELEEFINIAITSFTEDKNTYGEYPPFIDIENHNLRFINNAYTFKIVNDNEMIGGMIIFDNKDGRFTLGAIFIKPGYQSKGIGQQVITLMEEKFPKAKVWNLDTPYLSFRNHHFYEKMGYVKTGEEIPDKSSEFKLFLYEKTMNV